MATNKAKGLQGEPEIPLSEVKQLIRDGTVRIRQDVRQDALNDFGWDTDGILGALLNLKTEHFHKRDVSKRNPWHVYDFYKARGLCGEDVYTHFYVDPDDGYLVINSFKRI